MAYNTYSGYEMYWSQQQQHPAMYPSGQYYSLSPQDEHCTQWGLVPSARDQKDYLFQQQMTMPSAHFIMENSPCDMDMHQSNVYDRSARYVSPTASHHSSSFSDSSASTEHALTPNPVHQSTPFIHGTAPFLGQHTFTLPTRPVPQSVWQSPAHDGYAVLHPQANYPTFVPSQSPHSMSELGIVQHDEEDINMIFHDEVDAAHSKSPLHMPQPPEELELSEDQDDSTMSSVTDNDRATTSSRHSFQSNTSDEETEEDEEPVVVDHDSDSDYDNRPHRRRASRTTPRQKHSRKSSNNTIISPISRIHKRTSSSSTITSSTSTARVHNRRPSKSFKPKQKGPGPIFPSAKSDKPSSKSDRPYPCTFHRFGCTAEFPNKNEWKRHVACQHLQLGYYRCDLDGCNPDTSQTSSSSRNGRRGAGNTLSRTQSQTDTSNNSTDEIIKIYNDFNRKDLFTQHCRRMHGPSRNPALCSRPPNKKTGLLTPTKEDEAAFETQLTEIRARCWHVRRHAPSRSSCGFCKRLFDADNYDTSSTTSTSTCAGHGKENEGNAEEKAWEDRMEHVGRHYEKEGADRSEEEMDEDLVEWGVETGVLRLLKDGRAWLVSVEEPGEGVADDIVKSENGSGRVRVGSGSGTEDEKERKKARRQPSRTVVKVSVPVVQERRVSFEEGDTIVLGEGKVE